MGSQLATDPGRTVNQSGLSSSYTSNVTDFDAYIASNPTHDSTNSTNFWLSSDGTVTGNVDFDLGGSYLIESFALWNFGEGFASNVVGFNLLASDTADFSSQTVLLSSQSANTNTGPNNATLPEVFTFAPATASFVRLEITSNNGTTATSFGEAAFDVVPEPSSSLLMIGSGLAWLLKRRRTSL
jgi:hypothetical protein